MIDMKITREGMMPGALAGPTGQTENNRPQYPYGLRICLDGDSLKKLAMGLPQVGDVFQLEAMVEVVSVSKSENLIEDDNRVELQIQTMLLEAPEDERNEQQQSHDRISAMYGN